MAKDKYKALWISHSSMSDFLKCPKLYYLRNVYKDPKTNHKITVMTPPLALGQVVHDVINEISKLPQDRRFKESLQPIYDSYWQNISGKKGGFRNLSEEKRFKDRGAKMLERVETAPGPLINKAIKLKSDNGLSSYWFDEEENIILCGKVDWIEYLEGSDAIHIIDFKTGKHEESDDSLQLPVYLLLALNLQSRVIEKVSYWYLDTNDSPTLQPIPDQNASYAKILEIAKRIKLGRQINYFKCPKGGCFACSPLERVLAGEGELVGVSEYGQDIYILPDKQT